MVKIMTDPIRKSIKTAFVVQYIADCGLKMPQMPSIPDFTPPPMPDLSFVQNELSRIQSSMSSNNNDSIYTTDYINAYKNYESLVEAAKSKYNNKISEIDSKLENIRVSGTSIDNTTKELELMIQKNEAKKTYATEVSEARVKSNIDNVIKFKRIELNDKAKANETANKETQKSIDSEKQEAVALFKEIVLKQYTEWTSKEKAKVERLKKEIVSAYEDSVAMFNQVKQEAKDYFQEGGAGDDYINERCDKIDNEFSNFTESLKELAVDITTMVAKIPNPDVIVVGTAVGIPNPSEKITVFMEDFKKVMTDITKIINFIKEIISIAQFLKFAITDMIPIFKNACTSFDKYQEDAENSFREAVKTARKRQKWYLKHEHPKTENETKLAGYMYADLEVDWVNHDMKIKGYKCYCRRDYGRTYVEDGVIKKSLWIGGYRKNQGSYVDSSGKHYYYLSSDDICPQTEYDENDILKELVADAEESGFSLSEYDVDLGTNYNTTTGLTTLSLSDGRTVTIDYLAASGDIIRLNDGTILRVQ